ncbi:MAG TPA: phasin family protein [Caulobacteraceae bacterium]|jgi:hypothetical protein
MTPLKTLQTSPARTNDLFAQLAETGPGAVKTRERLFEALKAEVALSVRLQHDLMLPALKKHAGTKTVAAQTGERLGAIKSLLGRLDGEARDGEDFLTGVAELKAALQAHMREEKGALATQLQKLDEEELQTLADRFEAVRAEAEATARHDAEVERAQARRQREREEARQAAVEEAAREERRLAREAKAAAEAVERDTREAVEQTARAAELPAEAARAGADAGLRAVGETTRSFAAAAERGSAYARAAQDASREWASWAQAHAKNQMGGLSALLQCRTPQDLIALQTRMMRENVELLLETGTRVSGIAASAGREPAGRAG